MLLHLLLKATHEDQAIFFSGEKMTIKAGSLITGREVLSAETGIPQTSIERILGKLEKVGEIEQQKTTRNRLIIMKKWNQFQGERTTNGQQADNKRTTSGQQTDTYKNVKNEKNEKNKNQQSPLEVALNNFYEMRKAKKNPITEHAKELLVKKLGEMANDDETKIKIIEQSILHGWTGVFPLKESTAVQQPEPMKQPEVTYSPDDMSDKAQMWRLRKEYERKQKDENNENSKKLGGITSSVGRI